MLEFARVIHEKHGCCTIETVDIITKLADINCFKGMYLWLGLMFSCSSLACWMTNLIPPVWPPMWLILFPHFLRIVFMYLSKGSVGQ
jgi:FtsH-binding integral membrane protein